MTRAEPAMPPAVPHRDPGALRLLWRTGRVAAALAGGIGVAVLVSWMGGPRFARSGGQPIEVSPVTAVGILLAAAALLLQGLRHPAPRALRRLAALAVVAIGAARVLELAAGLDLRLESALAAIHPGMSGGGVRMLPATAGALLATGLALLSLEGRRGWRVVAQTIALALSPVPLVALVGYAYRVTLLYESSPVRAVARPLAVGWIARAMSAAGPEGACAVSVAVVPLTLVLALLVLRDAAALDRMELAAERAQAERERSRLELARALAREREARAHAEAASRAKDEFLTTLSHELRTPLNAILGWSRLLRDGPRDAQRLERGLQVVERNGRALAHLVADLLDMSRIARGVIQLERTEVELVAPVEAAVEAVGASAEAKGVRIGRTVGEGVPRVIGDPARLQQIAWNLLSNAVKF